MLRCAGQMDAETGAGPADETANNPRGGPTGVDGTGHQGAA